MKEKIKSFLIKYPALYQLIQSLYWILNGFKARILGTRRLEKYWRKYPFDLQKELKNLDHPHRQFLIKKISHYQLFSKVLEFGCGYGPNLYLLAKKFPQVKFMGIDINFQAITAGKKWLAENQIFNIQLLSGDLDGISEFKEKEFDIVFTDAVLMYVGPDKIKEAIKNLLRICQKALILVEWHIENKEEYDVHTGVWRYNYVSLLKELALTKKISLTKITPEIWPDKNWQKYGYVIEVKL